MVSSRCSINMVLLSLLVLVVYPFSSSAFPGDPINWLKTIWPDQPQPEDPHLYPDGSLLYDIWTCKGETELGWIGVTQQFTDRDPCVVVAVRFEFDENMRLRHYIGVELIGPRNNRIVASDRVRLFRNQDVGFFYHPNDLGRLGGYGEYTAILLIDGTPKDEITFRIDRVEDLKRQMEEEAQLKETKEAFADEGLEAKSLLGEPDSQTKLADNGDRRDSVPKPKLQTPDKKKYVPDIEVMNAEDWYRTNFFNEEGRMIMFPKKPRRHWEENVNRDLSYRIRYYIFL